MEPLHGAGQVFTIILILAGVGTALYTLTVGLELIVEGHLGAVMERRRMDKRIDGLRNHVILCGWGRVGRAIAKELGDARREVVIVDNDPERVATVDRLPYVLGDATSDDVCAQAGIGAGALVAALSTDAANLFITLSGRALRPDLFVVAHAARTPASRSSPGPAPTGWSTRRRSAAPGWPRSCCSPTSPSSSTSSCTTASIELRLEEVEVPAGSPFVGQSLRQAKVHDHTGALVLALRHVDGTMLTNPDPDTELVVGQIIIAIGTDDQLHVLVAAVSSTPGGPGTPGAPMHDRGDGASVSP